MIWPNLAKLIFYRAQYLVFSSAISPLNHPVLDLIILTIIYILIAADGSQILVYFYCV